MFADDSNLIIAAKPHELPLIIERLQEDLQHVCLWIQSNYIKLNVEKTKYRNVGKPGITSKLPEFYIKVDDKIHKLVNTMKLLDICYDAGMNWSTLMNHECRKGFGALSKLRLLKHGV